MWSCNNFKSFIVTAFFRADRPVDLTLKVNSVTVLDFLIFYPKVKENFNLFVWIISQQKAYSIIIIKKKKTEGYYSKRYDYLQLFVYYLSI